VFRISAGKAETLLKQTFYGFAFLFHFVIQDLANTGQQYVALFSCTRNSTHGKSIFATQWRIDFFSKSCCGIKTARQITTATS